MIAAIPKITQAYKYFRRYREIIFILFKYGFKDWLETNRILQYFTINEKKGCDENSKDFKHLGTWERIRLAIEELGPTFIKFGQVLSNRPDVLPEGLIRELIKLQEAAPPFDGKLAKQIVNEELQCSLKSIFTEFEEKPIASASIAQVHAARLINGDKVAVKIQRPGIKKQIETDLAVMEHLASVLQKNVKEVRAINPVPIVKEFGNTIRKEIDFQIEQSHIERFRNNFKNEKKIYVPAIYKEYSTKKLLILEYIEGIGVRKTEELIKNGIDPKHLATIGTNLIFKQIFEHGFFHADPHPGNLYILRDGRICFIDFGMMGVLLPKYREHLADFIIGFVNGDVRKISKTLLKLAVTYEPLNIDLFEAKISELIEQFTYQPLKEINMGDIMTKAIDLVIEHKIQMPPSIYLLTKAMITIEGVARILEPDFDMIAHFKPFAKKLLKERLNPLTMLKANYFALVEFSNLVNDLPFEIREIFGNLKTGRLALHFEENGRKEKLKTYKQLVKMLSLAILCSAFVISGVYAQSHIQEAVFYSLPIISIINYTLGSLCFFSFLWLLLKK